MSITVERLVAEIEADPSAALASLAQVEAALDVVSRDRTANIDVDVDRNPVDRLGQALTMVMNSARGAASALPDFTQATQQAGGAVNALAGGGGGGGRGGLYVAAGGFRFFAAGAAGALAGLVSLVPMIGAMVTVVAVLPGLLSMAAAAAAAFTAAIAPLAGLLGVIPVGLGLLGGGLLAVVAGLGGVGEGLKAMTGLEKDAGAATEDLAAKTRALAMAQRGLRDAQHAAAESFEALQKAREAYRDAPREAREAMEDQRRAVKQAVLSEEAAVLRLKRAQENLANAQNKTAKSGMILSKETDYFTGKVYEVARQSADAVDNAEDERQARLDLRQAELDLAAARDNTSDQQREMREMEKKGIKNSDIMVAARESLTDAEWAYKKSLEGVKDAEYSLTQARKNLTTATTQGTAAMQAYNDAMEKLTPVGKKFVTFLHDEFLPAWEDVQKQVQKKFLPGILRGLRAIKGNFDEMGDSLGDMGSTMGDAFGDFMEFWSKPRQTTRLTDMFDGLNGILGKVTKMMRPLSRIFVSLIEAATPMVDLMAKDLLGNLRQFADWLETDKGKKKTGKFFMDGYKWLKRWGDVLGPMVGVLKGVIKAATPLAKWMFKEMGEYFTDLSERVNNVEGQKGLKKWFENQKPALSEFGELVRNVLDLLFNSTAGGKESAFYRVMKELNDNTLPALKDIITGLDQSEFPVQWTKGLTDLTEIVASLKGSNTIKVIEGVASAIMRIGGALQYVHDQGADKEGNQSWWEKFLFGRNGDPNSFQEQADQQRKEGDAFLKWWDKHVNEGLGGALRRFGADMKKWWNQTFWPDFKASWTTHWDNLKQWAIDFDWSGMWDGIKDAFVDMVKDLADIDWSEIGPKWLPKDKDGSINWFPGGDYNGGYQRKGRPRIVGEKGPEMFVPTTSGRIMPTVPSREYLESNGAGISDAQLERVMRAVQDGGKRVSIEQTFNEKVDPMLVSHELAWRLG